MNPYYTDFGEYMSRWFGDAKIQKISVNTAAGCPNRDGTIGYGGCTYCNNASFTPSYCLGTDPVAVQLQKGMDFFSRKYRNMKFLAYFQSYTPTYLSNLARFAQQCAEALSLDGIAGLTVASRPDCITGPVIDLLGRLNANKPLFVELGVETLNDDTLKRVNRGHDSKSVRDALALLHDAGIPAGVHLIAGLPGESLDDVKTTVGEICRLPVDSIKMHHLQILEGTPLAKEWECGTGGVTPLELQDYLEFCVWLIKRVPKRIAIERFTASAPPQYVLAPKWGLKNHEFTNILTNRLRHEKNDCNHGGGIRRRIDGIGRYHGKSEPAGRDEGF